MHDFVQSLVGKGQLDSVECEKLFILRYECVFRLGENPAQIFRRKLFKVSRHRKSADKFGNETETEKIFRLDFGKDVLFFGVFAEFGTEAHFLSADSACYDFVDPFKRAADNEKNVGSVDFDVFLLRMFSATGRRNICYRSFNDFEKRLLDAFTADVAGDRSIFRFARDFVYLVDVDYAAFGLFNIVICSLNQRKKDVFDIFADVSRLGESRCIGYAERNIEKCRQSPRQKRFS